ncbi:MAG: hypothetical protein V4450_01310 [Bacteroidota bacterium]
MANTSAEFLELERFFSQARLPESMQLEPGSFIPNVARFVEGNLDSLRSGAMNEVAAAGRYYRMQQLKKLLSK